MRNIVIHGPGDLRIEDHSPRDCENGEVRVRIEAGGICGSDLHYYNHGGFGAVRLREPMILGHEVAGQIIEVGQGVNNLATGQRVAVSPSRPCLDCTYCAQGLMNHCENMAFYGSAMPMPHIQGAFRDDLVVSASQCHVMAPGLDATMAAFAEPLSVVLHGCRRAGPLKDQRVLVVGCGPIGALTILAARHFGAAEVVAVDIIDPMLAKAAEIGADRTINAAQSLDWVNEFARGKGVFDVMFEASGSGAALVGALPGLRPRARVVQLGLGADAQVPLSVLVAKELDIRGSFRFHEEFKDAVDLINSGDLDLAPLLSERFPVDDAVAAFEAAGNKAKGTMKVQLDFTM